MPASTIVRVDQSAETAVQDGRDQAFAWRWAYARAAETQACGDLGQDYLTFGHDSNTFVFALCDGVSQSFYGNIAASFLGDALCDWLWQAAPSSPKDQLGAALGAYLRDLIKPATELVDRQRLPTDQPAVVLEVLEQKRAHGSESTFICGRFDLPAKIMPAGQLLMAWMGDSRLRLWGPDGERTGELGDRFDVHQRWSSSQGPVGGLPHVFVTTFLNVHAAGVTRVMAYSDGLAALDTFQHRLSNTELQNLLRQTAESPTSDDISFLEVSLLRNASSS